MAIAGTSQLRCRKCEGHLGKPRIVNPADYGIVKNEHGAIIRCCQGCVQLWVGYVAKLPDCGMKIILKMVDKEI